MQLRLAYYKAAGMKYVRIVERYSLLFCMTVSNKNRDEVELLSLVSWETYYTIC